MHQKHRPALQQQRSATDENMELPLTYPFRQSRCFFFQAADLQRDALGARDKEQDGSKHTVMIHCSILTTLVHSGPQGDGSGYHGPHNIQAFVPNPSERRSSTGSVRLIFDMMILTDLQPKRSELSSSVDTLLWGLVSLRRAWVRVNVSFLNQPIKESLTRFVNMTYFYW